MSALLTDRVGVVTDSNDKDGIVVFDRTNNRFKKYSVKKALEIEYLPADDYSKTVTMEGFEITELTSNHIKIKVIFDYPELIDHEDLIRIDIWVNGVLPGTELFVPISA